MRSEKVYRATSLPTSGSSAANDGQERNGISAPSAGEDGEGRDPASGHGRASGLGGAAPQMHVLAGMRHPLTSVLCLFVPAPYSFELSPEYALPLFHLRRALRVLH